MSTTGAAPDFSVGELAVYPAQGITEVVSIVQKEVSGQVHDFYVLRVVDSEQKILVPVRRARQIGLRPPASPEDIRDLFQNLEEAPFTYDDQTWNRRYRGFIDKIKTGSLVDVAEVVRDLHRLRALKELSFSERKMLETAQKLLVQELAVSEGTSEDAARRSIEEAFAPETRDPEA
jgi:CarD family transcriptional regulator